MVSIQGVIEKGRIVCDTTKRVVYTPFIVLVIIKETILSAANGLLVINHGTQVVKCVTESVARIMVILGDSRVFSLFKNVPPMISNLKKIPSHVKGLKWHLHSMVGCGKRVIRGCRKVAGNVRAVTSNILVLLSKDQQHAIGGRNNNNRGNRSRPNYSGHSGHFGQSNSSTRQSRSSTSQPNQHVRSQTGQNRRRTNRGRNDNRMNNQGRTGKAHASTCVIC